MSPRALSLARVSDLPSPPLFEGMRLSEPYWPSRNLLPADILLFSIGL